MINTLLILIVGLFIFSLIGLLKQRIWLIPFKYMGFGAAVLYKGTEAVVRSLILLLFSFAAIIHFRAELFSSTNFAYMLINFLLGSVLGGIVYKKSIDEYQFRRVHPKGYTKIAPRNIIIGVVVGLLLIFALLIGNQIPIPQ